MIFEGIFSSAGNAAVTLLSPSIRSGVVSFSFETASNQVAVVQATPSLATGWVDLTNYAGAGGLLTFSAAAAASQQFFRVALQERAGLLGLLPNTPVLTNGDVSLPDAMVGSAYLQTVSAGKSGRPPYTLAVSGSPPDGVAVVLTNNASGEAAALVFAAGSVLSAGQRRQFEISVTDGAGVAATRRYDLRVIPPPPGLDPAELVLKAGEVANKPLPMSGGMGINSWSMLSGTLPQGILIQDGLIVGTPTAGAAELNELGRYTNVVELSDAFTDRVTGALTPRKSTNNLTIQVRLSYGRNIRASRAGGPSLLSNCGGCHDGNFPPNVNRTDLSELVNAPAGSGIECDTSWVYVAAGEPSASLIYRKVSAAPPCGDRMPQGGSLTAQQIGRIERWIRELTNEDFD